MKVGAIVINSIQIFLNKCSDRHPLPILDVLNRGVDY